MCRWRRPRRAGGAAVNTCSETNNYRTRRMRLRPPMVVWRWCVEAPPAAFPCAVVDSCYSKAKRIVKM